MSDDLKQNIRERKTWLRGLYMLLFLIFYSVAEVVIFVVVAFQFVLTLLTAQTNDRLVKLGQSLCTYQYQILTFLTFNSNQHPYPFGAWPKGPPTTTKKVSKKVIESTEE